MVDRKRGKSFNLYLNPDVHAAAQKVAQRDSTTLSEMVGRYLADVAGLQIPPAPAVRSSGDVTALLQGLVSHALARRASHLRLLCGPDEAVVSIRIDGREFEVSRMDAKEGDAICRTVFTMGDSSDHSYQPSYPQVVRISRNGSRISERLDAAEVRYAPLHHGGRIMSMKLVRNDSALRSMDEFLMDERSAALVTRWLGDRDGIHLVVGGTSSGRSSFLDAVAALLAGEDAEEARDTVTPGRLVVSVSGGSARSPSGVLPIQVAAASSWDERKGMASSAILSAASLDADVMLVDGIQDEHTMLATLVASTRGGPAVWASVTATSMHQVADMFDEISSDRIRESTVLPVAGVVRLWALPRLSQENSRPMVREDHPKLWDTWVSLGEQTRLDALRTARVSLDRDLPGEGLIVCACAAQLSDATSHSMHQWQNSPHLSPLLLFSSGKADALDVANAMGW